MADLIKKQSNPFSTGGGGVNFETRVQATFIVLMLTGKNCFCLPPWPIVKLKFQGRYAGFNTDDLIIFVKCPNTGSEAKLLAQIKHSIGITEGNDIFGEVIKAAWNDFNNPKTFTIGTDAFALVTGPLSATDIDNTRSILEWARHSEDEKEFLYKINIPNFSSDIKRAKLQVFRTHLKNANDGVDISDKQLWKFLKAFNLIGYDLDTQNGTSLSLFQSLIGQNSTEKDKNLWFRIVDFVQLYNQNAGTLKLSNIPDDIREAFTVRQNSDLKMKDRGEGLYEKLTDEQEKFEVTSKPIYNGSGEYIVTREKVRLRAHFPKFPNLSGWCIIDFASLNLKNCLFEFTQKEIMTNLFKGLHTNYRLGLRGFFPIYSPNAKKQFIQFGKCTIFVTEKEVEELCQVIDAFSDDLLNEIEELQKPMGTVQFMPSLRYQKDGYRLVRIDRNLWRKALDFANSNSIKGGDSRWQIFDWCDGLLKIYTETGNQAMDRGYHAIIYPEEAECFYTNHRTSNDFVWLVWRPMTSDSNFDVFEDFSYRRKWNATITYNWLLREFLPSVIKHSKLREGTYDIHIDGDWSFDLNNIKNIEELKTCVSSLQRFYNSSSHLVFLKSADQRLIYSAVSNSLNVASFDDISYILGNLNVPYCLDIDQITANLRELKSASKDSVVGSFAIDCTLRVILYACDNIHANLDEHSVSKIANCLKPYYEHYRQCKLLEKYSYQ